MLRSWWLRRSFIRLDAKLYYNIFIVYLLLFATRSCFGILFWLSSCVRGKQMNGRNIPIFGFDKNLLSFCEFSEFFFALKWNLGFFGRRPSGRNRWDREHWTIIMTSLTFLRNSISFEGGNSLLFCCFLLYFLLELIHLHFLFRL